MQFDNRPIGLFDSGIGGLTVLNSLMTALPGESFTYLGDTARLPYGSKSSDTIEKYLKQNIQYLLSQGIKAVVVACNSASTVLLRKKIDYPLPIYNVIQPGASVALAATQNKRIGVLGTRATVAAQSYCRALHDLDQTVVVYQQACPLLVPLVEEGLESDPLTHLIIYRYLSPLLTCQIDTLIMGCTHYPALREGISRVVGPNVTLVDSATAIANEIKKDLEKGRLFASSERPKLRILTTDLTPGFAEVAARLMRPHIIPPLEATDLC